MTKSSAEQNYLVQPGGSLRGTFAVPGDKSISHRALMFGMIAHGVSTVSGLLYSEDVKATLACCRFFGTRIDVQQPSSSDSQTDSSTARSPGMITIHGQGDRLSTDGTTQCDMGNSGTAMRLLTGLLCGYPVNVTLVGDASLSERPMKRIADPLNRMGASVSTSDSGTPPVHIRPSAGLVAIEEDMKIASAQVKSAILLAGLHATGTTIVREPRASRDHTERMLGSFGVEVQTRELAAGREIQMRGGQSLQATAITVPGDLSSAAFFMVGAAIAEDSRITITGVGTNPTRDGVLTILRQMGANIECVPQRGSQQEPVADMTISTSKLHGIEIGADLVALAIDEIPVIAVAAACASGRTIITGARELRHKESDRIDAVVRGLRSIGVQVSELDDGMVIDGGLISGGEVDSFDDHRIAMAFTIAALRSSGLIKINKINNIATSFPEFSELAKSLGLNLETTV